MEYRYLLRYEIDDEVHLVDEIISLLICMNDVLLAIVRIKSADYLSCIVAFCSQTLFTNACELALNYAVNFGTKEGQGTITLEKGIIGKRYDRTIGISGNAVAENWKNDGIKGSYLLDFYGPWEEEIAGTANLRQEYSMSSYNKAEFGKLPPDGTQYRNLSIGFGSTRGEIKK